MDKDLDTLNLEFDYIDKVGYYTKNNLSNKTMPAIERPKILNGILQFIDNTNRIMRQLNAYDSSSILIAESNWMKRNHLKNTPSDNAPKKVSTCAVRFYSHTTKLGTQIQWICSFLGHYKRNLSLSEPDILIVILIDHFDSSKGTASML